MDTFFMIFDDFLRILTILGVACHVPISAIGFKNHPNPKSNSLAIKTELYKIKRPSQAVCTSLQNFIFSLQKIF